MKEGVRETVDLEFEPKDWNLKRKSVLRVPLQHTRSGIIVAGKYATACGGFDSVPTQAVAKEVVRLASELGPTLFEGVVISTIFEPWLLWRRSTGIPMVWGFLDTPLEVCLGRIQERNGGKPIKEDLVAGKWRTINRVKEKAEAAGEVVTTIRWDRDGAEQVKEILL
jgi:hypothetical protein